MCIAAATDYGLKLAAKVWVAKSVRARGILPARTLNIGTR